MPLAAIVFDFDGVLANSEPLHFRALRDELAARGIPLTEADYYAEYLGFDDVGALSAVAAKHGLSWGPAAVAALVESKAARMEALERDVSVLFPGAADAVRRAAEVVPIAIASGALGKEIRRVLDREGLTACFAAIVGAEETAASKPAPDPYLRALARLGSRLGAPVPAADCVAVEDSHWGLESARRAGLRTVAIAHTYPADALQEADLVLPDIAHFDVERLRNLYAT
jgi:beta-phosphoglucomutase-like phosphatase (HAD superfamily)